MQLDDAVSLLIALIALAQVVVVPLLVAALRSMGALRADIALLRTEQAVTQSDINAIKSRQHDHETRLRRIERPSVGGLVGQSSD